MGPRRPAGVMAGEFVCTMTMGGKGEKENDVSL